MVQWLGLSSFTAVARVQSLVRELRSCKPRGTAKNNNNKIEKLKNKLKNKEEEFEVQGGGGQVTRGRTAGRWQSWALRGQDAAAGIAVCTRHSAGCSLCSILSNSHENPFEVIIIAVVIVMSTLWMQSTSLGDIQGHAAAKRGQAV